MEDIDVNELIKIVKEDYRELKNIDETFLIAHPEICMEAVKQNLNALQYVPEEVKLSHIEICMEAVKQKGYALQYVPEEVKLSHIEICMEAVKQDGYALQYVPEKVKLSHIEICMEAVKKNGNALQYVPEEVKLSHIEICIEAVKRNAVSLEYVPEKVKMPENMYIEAVKKHSKLLQYVPNEIKISHPEICFDAVKQDGSLLQHVPNEIKNANPEICFEAVKARLRLSKSEIQFIRKNSKMNRNNSIETISRRYYYMNFKLFKDISKDILVSNPSIVRYVLDDDVGNVYHIDENIALAIPEIFEKYKSYFFGRYEILKTDDSNNGLLTGFYLDNSNLITEKNNEVKTDNYELDIDKNEVTYKIYNMLKNMEIIKLLNQKGFTPETFRIFDVFLNEKKLIQNVDDLAAIRKKSKWNVSQEYRGETEQELIIKMFKTLGKDEALRLMSIPELSEDKIEEISKNSTEMYNELFEEKYELEGDIGIVSNLFNELNIGTLNSKGKNHKLEIYRKINQLLEDGKDVDIEEIVLGYAKENGIDISEKSKSNIKKAVRNMNISVAESKYNVFRKEIEGKIDSYVQSDVEPLKRLVKSVYDEYAILSSNNIDTDELKKLIKDKLNQKNENGIYSYSRHMRDQEEKLIKALNEIFESNEISKEIKKNITDVLSNVKKTIGKGWMSKLDNLPKELSKEEFEKLEERLGMQIESQKHSMLKLNEIKSIKDPIKREEKRKELEERVYSLLKDSDVYGLLTYEKAEMMFGGITEEVPEEFSRFFRLNKEEIMSKPEYYTRFARLANGFKSVIEDPHIKNRYEDGQLGVKEVFEILDSRTYESLEKGTYELARLSKKSGLDEKQFEYAKEIFAKTKEREYQTIPPAKVTEKKYRGRILRADDPLHLVVGNITTCCQAVGNVGEGAMLHSAMEKNGGVFVVEEIDEEGKVTRVVGQSWVWRNKDRLCFDNIEISNVAHSEMSKEDEKEILDVYMKSGEKIIENDKKLLGKMLKEGKISQEAYDRLVIKEVTAGVGYNDLRVMTEMEEEGKLHTTSIVSPIEEEKEYINSQNVSITPWVDSGEKQIVLAKMNDKERKDIQERVKVSNENKEKKKKEYILEDVPAWYGKERQVEDLTEKEITVDTISEIKKIESAVYRETQQTLQSCYDAQDLKDVYELSDNMKVSISKDSDWYAIYEERENELYIADIALVGGANSEKNEELSFDKKAATLELFEKIYSLLEEMGRKGKTVRFEATRDTSYLNVQNMLKKGLIEVKENKEDTFYSDDSIEMNNMVIKPIPEKIEKELESIRKLLEKVYEKKMIKGVEVKKKSDAGDREV